MAENNVAPQSENSGSPEGTGTENIIRRHLQDPHHVISDEEIRNVAVGKSDDEVALTGAEASARFGIEEPNEEGKKAGDGEVKPPNPWDVLD